MVIFRTTIVLVEFRKHLFKHHSPEQEKPFWQTQDVPFKLGYVKGKFEQSTVQFGNVPWNPLEHVHPVPSSLISEFFGHYMMTLIQLGNCPLNPLLHTHVVPKESGWELTSSLQSTCIGLQFGKTPTKDS